MIYSPKYGITILSCDICEYSPEDVGFETFKEASQWARAHNWQTRKVDGDWENLCPDCAREEGLLPPDIVPMQKVEHKPPTARWVKYGSELDLPK